MNSLQYLSTHVDSLIGEKVGSYREGADSDTPGGGEPSESAAASAEKSAQETKEPTPESEQIVAPIRTSLWTYLWALFSREDRRSAHKQHSPSPSSSGLASITTFPDPAKSRKPSNPSASGADPGIKLLLPPINRPLLRKAALNHKKTLVLDLDETLIHSLSRTSKFSTGHMVEVKLDNMVPTLYHINKRPYCDLFLDTVSEWFNLVVFTASVRQYADPMIDWLEQSIPGKYFTQRLYRNDCTETQMGYAKDLTRVHHELAHIILIDNSPVSYELHPNNAIGIKGWISDPTDVSLLHLLPFLQALRYTYDVRSVLCLKNGNQAFT